MAWIQVGSRDSSPLILWNEGFISYLLTALKAKFLSAAGLSYIVLTVVFCFLSKQIADNITVKREWSDRKFGDEKVSHNILRSKYYDIYLKIKDENHLPKWLRDDTCKIQFKPKIKSISTIDVFPLQFGIDHTGEINQIEVPLPEEWKQKENLQWPTQYKRGKVFFNKIPKNDDSLDFQMFTNKDRSILCIEILRENSPEAKHCYLLNDNFLVELDSSDRIYRLWFKIAQIKTNE